MTMMFVAATGGHLSQLVELEKRIDGPREGRIWVTFDSPQSRSLLADRNVEYIASIEERDLPGAIRALRDAYALISKHRPKAMISTGSAIAVPFLNVAAMRGVASHYIESAARVSEASLTGRLIWLNPAIEIYRQYENAVSGRWRYAGSVFDAFETVQNARQRRKPHRIVVTVGTGVHAFTRLIRRLVEILPREAEVFWQTGSTPVQGLGIEARPNVPASVLEREIAAADVVIGHAGCGTALSALRAGKVPILAPRTSEFGELVDSHQVQIAEWLGHRDLALCRQPESITYDDLITAASRTVQPATNLPPLQLA